MLRYLLPIAAALTLVSAAPALAAGPTIVATARDMPIAAKFTADGAPLGLARATRLAPVTTATGDVTGDGRDDRVTSADGIVTVTDGGVAVRRFSPYADRAIIAIAVADIDGDGHADIVTAPTSGTPFVKVFSGASGGLLRAFLAGGSDKAIIAIAAERTIIAVLIGPDIRVYDATTLATRAFFRPFGGAPVGGVAIA